MFFFSCGWGWPGELNDPAPKESALFKGVMAGYNNRQYTPTFSQGLAGELHDERHARVSSAFLGGTWKLSNARTTNDPLWGKYHVRRGRGWRAYPGVGRGQRNYSPGREVARASCGPGIIYDAI